MRWPCPCGQDSLRDDVAGGVLGGAAVSAVHAPERGFVADLQWRPRLSQAKFGRHDHVLRQEPHKWEIDVGN
jgi:hypothetical protein